METRTLFTTVVWEVVDTQELRPGFPSSSSASVFYGGALGDKEDREALASLAHACLNLSDGSSAQAHTPQCLLATLTPSPGKLWSSTSVWVEGSARHGRSQQHVNSSATKVCKRSCFDRDVGRVA